MAVTFGCSLPSRGPLASPQNLRALAQRAEALGFASVWVSDHIVLPQKVESFYPYAADGVAPFRAGQAYYDPIAILNFLAGCTQRVKLGTHVLIIPYRPPIQTAKLLATLDALSGGRLILGAGVGWMKEEFEALGLATFEERGAVTNEHLQVFKALWTQDEVNFEGKHIQVRGAGFEPKPAQKPHPPIWIGGHTGPALRRAAQLGDGWMPIGLRPPAVLEPEELAGKLAQLRRLTVAAGRPENAVTPCFSSNVAFDRAPALSRRMMQGRPEQIAADLRQYQDVGVQNFVISFPGDSVAALQEGMEQFSRDVMPLIPQ